MKQTEQEKADYFMSVLHDVNSCVKICDIMIEWSLVLQPQKDFYQRVKQILIDKQK